MFLTVCPSPLSPCLPWKCPPLPWFSSLPRPLYHLPRFPNLLATCTWKSHQHLIFHEFKWKSFSFPPKFFLLRSFPFSKMGPQWAGLKVQNPFDFFLFLPMTNSYHYKVLTILLCNASVIHSPLYSSSGAASQSMLRCSSLNMTHLLFHTVPED